MAVITRLSADEVTQLLAHYDVGSLSGFKEASEGIENTNYFVKTVSEDHETCEFVLTLIEEVGTVHSRESMVKILDRCEQVGLPVPQLIRTRDNESEAEFNGKAVLLCSMLQGRHVLNPLEDQCAAIGRFLARFHNATESIQSGVSPYIRDEDWLESNTQKVVEYLPPFDRNSLKETLRQTLELLQRKDTSQLPTAVIHADLFRDNALFNEYGLSGILDFHHAGRGYCIYDLAVAVNDWCRNGQGLDKRRTLQLLRGYASIRPLAQVERWLFPGFLVYAALAFWLSRLLMYVRDDLPAHYPIKDPNELKALVLEHQRHPFGLLQEAFA